MPIAVGDGPVSLTVKNTFLEVEGLRTPSSRSLRARSEPISFKPPGLEQASTTDDEDALSAASTEASSESEQPRQRPTLLPIDMSRIIALHSTRQPEEPPWSPRYWQNDDSCKSYAERKLTFVATPSTFGRRTPENAATSTEKKVSFALLDSSDEDPCESLQHKPGCLRKPSSAGRRASDHSPTKPARRVSFAAVDEVVHIPVEEVGVLKHVPVTPALCASTLPDVARMTSASMLRVAHGALSSSVSRPRELSAAAPPSPLHCSTYGGACSSANALPTAKVACAPVGLVAPPWSQATVAPSAPSAALAVSPCSSTTESKPSVPNAWARFGDVVENVRSSLEASTGIVVCAEAKEGARGWTITAYVQPKALKPCREQLLAAAQHCVVAAVDRSESVCLLGFGATPFTPMPLGFGAAIADMPDRSRTCWSSFSRGFCDNPGACCKEHPKRQVGVNVMLKPARVRA